MKRYLGAAVVFAVTAGLVVAQDIRRGTVKSVDADKGTVTITADGKDETFIITSDTKVMGADGKAIAKPFEDKSLAPGTQVMFKGTTRDGKPALVGLKVGGAPQPAQQPKADTAKLKPL